jgi:hypothetical protein
MANKEFILDKIVRNMKQRGYSAERSGELALITKAGGDILSVSYVAKSVQSPMGGIDDASSPFLGIGVAAPGSLKIKGEAGENTLAAIFDTVEALELMHEVAGYANDVVVEAGDSSSELARVRGHEHLLGMGS